MRVAPYLASSSSEKKLKIELEGSPLIVQESHNWTLNCSIQDPTEISNISTSEISNISLRILKETKNESDQLIVTSLPCSQSTSRVKVTCDETFLSFSFAPVYSNDSAGYRCEATHRYTKEILDKSTFHLSISGIF